MILLVSICTTENDDLPVMCTAKILQFCPEYCRMASFVSTCTAENKLPFEFSTRNSPVPLVTLMLVMLLFWWTILGDAVGTGDGTG